MQTRLNLFREPVTLDGYVPKFSREEVKLGYTYSKSEVYGWNMYGDEDPCKEKEYHETWKIKVAGKEIFGTRNYYSGSVFEIVAEIANAYLEGAKYHPRIKEEAAYKWLVENASDLTNSNRYWAAVAHREDIQRVKDKIADLQEQVRIGEIWASVRAVQVHEERSYSHDERMLLAAEFGLESKS